MQVKMHAHEKSIVCVSEGRENVSVSNSLDCCGCMPYAHLFCLCMHIIVQRCDHRKAQESETIHTHISGSLEHDCLQICLHEKAMVNAQL